MKFGITIYSDGFRGETLKVEGVEAAWEAYKTACELAELVGKNCELVDWQTAEVIACTEDF